MWLSTYPARIANSTWLTIEPEVPLLMYLRREEVRGLLGAGSKTLFQ